VEHTKLLLRLFWYPGAAMSAILDRGSLLFASLAALVFSFLLPRFGFALSFYTPLLVLALFYVPGVVVLSKLWARLGGSLGAVFQRDYSPLLTCTAMGLDRRKSSGACGGVAASRLHSHLCCCSGIPLLRGSDVLCGAHSVWGWELDLGGGGELVMDTAGSGGLPVGTGPVPAGVDSSPFFLFYAYYYLGGEIASLGAGLSSRQNFQRMLQAAAVNPHDGAAQYQLGLIYQQRHQNTEAIQRFQKAVAIDPTETDAHFQLGRIAREQGRLPDALRNFQTVLNQDERHSQYEGLRELGPRTSRFVNTRMPGRC
jgi:tetratricopeptide (TPR) repeat protein